VAAPFCSTMVAVLLGLRHATDPDHLSAVTTIVVAEPDRRAQHAARLGLAWGAGHATTLFILGLPIVLFSSYLPGRVLQAAEALIGLVIIGLAVRLLVRWRRGLIHAHPHEHDGLRHTHPHGHALPHSPGSEVAPAGRLPFARATRALAARRIRHRARAWPGRKRRRRRAPARLDLRQADGVAAMALFAVFTAVSMASCSGAFGAGFSTAPLRRAFDRVVPALGAASLAFGVAYMAGALELATYPF
jgi:hypothetical protein